MRRAHLQNENATSKVLKMLPGIVKCYMELQRTTCGIRWSRFSIALPGIVHLVVQNSPVTAVATKCSL